MKRALPLGLLLAAPLLSYAPRARGQAAEASEPDAQRSLVVVADLSSDATANAKLRAALYEAARGRGLSPAIKADVQAAALASGTLSAGQITADPAGLEKLRAALGVAYLGRVSKEFDQGGTIGVKVTLLTPNGPKSESVQAPAAAPERPVESAFGRLLDGTGVEPSPPPAAEEPPPAATVVAGGLVLDEDAVPIEKSGAQVREDWEARGGAVPMFAAFILATVQQRRGIEVTGSPPGGGVERGTSEANGIGGGIGARLAFWYMSLPEPITGQGVFPVFRLGLGLDSNFLYVRYPTGFGYSGTQSTREVTYEDRGFWAVNLPLQIGFHLGAGKFTTESTWRGAVIGLAYSPTMQFEIDMNRTEGEFRFNELGAELSVDIATIDTDETRETQIRLMIYGLYPKDDDHPGLVTAGLGAAFY